MIVSFADVEAERIFDGARSRRFRGLEHIIERKLRSLHQAATLADLMNPPGNRLEILRQDRAGQHSIRVNDRYRVCFRWQEGNAHEVEVVDYH